jgi:hypothetical protein
MGRSRSIPTTWWAGLLALLPLTACIDLPKVHYYPEAAIDLAPEAAARIQLAPDQTMQDVQRGGHDRYFFVPYAYEGQRWVARLGINAIDGNAAAYKPPVTLAPGEYSVRLQVELIGTGGLSTRMIGLGGYRYVHIPGAQMNEAWEVEIPLTAAAGAAYEVRLREDEGEGGVRIEFVPSR